MGCLVGYELEWDNCGFVMGMLDIANTRFLCVWHCDILSRYDRSTENDAAVSRGFVGEAPNHQQVVGTSSYILLYADKHW